MSQRRWTGPEAPAHLWGVVEEALATNTLARATWSGPVDPSGPRAVVARPVALKAGLHLQISIREGTRERATNHPIAEALAVCTSWTAQFQHLTVVTAADTWSLDLRGPARLTRAEGGSSPQLAHDRRPQRALEPEAEAPWMAALGLLDAQGRPKRDGEDKVHQVVRFVELLGHAVQDLPKPRLRLVDIGTGKGHLAFGAWSWLRKHGWSEAEVLGIELRHHLVDAANRVATDLHMDGLTFRAAAAADLDLQGVDVVVALHACDTATDDALARGVAAGAARLIVAPCCHRELRPQIRPPTPLQTALRHGIILEREAELLTDTLRAALLGAAGYDTRIIEFVPSEHTARNLLVVGSHNPRADREARRSEAVRLAQFYGVQHQTLAEQLGVDLSAG